MRPAILGLITAAGYLLPLSALAADFHIFSPYEIDLGELEIEHNGAATFDHAQDKGGAQAYTLEVGTGLTSWWHSEIELAFTRDPGLGQPTLLSQIVSENTFQLTEPGEYPVDLGFYVEYAQSLTSKRFAAPNEVTFGPLIAKDIGRTTTTLNLFATRQLGPSQDTHGYDFSYAVQTRWNWTERFSPAIEAYGDPGVVGAFPGLSKQQLILGPVAIGAFKLNDLGLGQGGKLKYELGWLFGATHASAAGTLRWRLELEIPL